MEIEKVEQEDRKSRKESKGKGRWKECNRRRKQKEGKE